MKHKKALISLMLALVLTLGLLPAGLAQSGPITLTAYSQLANWDGELTGWFAKILLDKFNVKINVIPDNEGVYETRMESGDLGDLVIWGSDGEEYQAAVEYGMLFDWEDEDLVQEYGPYIYEHMQPALEKNREISGGKVYGFGHNVATTPNDHESFFYTWDLRWDLYKQLGYPQMKTLEDMIPVFEKMKEIAPTDDNGNETFAVSLWPDWDGDMVMYVKATATAYYGYDELGIGLYNPQNGEYYDALMPDGPYLRVVKFFNQLYRKGLLDPNSMVNTYDTMIEKVQNGGTFFSIFNYAGSMAYNTQEHQDQNKMMLTWLPEEASPIAYGMNVKGGNRVWSIGAKSMYPELVMEIINWLATPEGRLTSDYGPKGLTWDYDENGKTMFTELGKLTNQDRRVNLTEKTNGEWNGLFGEGSNQLNNTTWSINATNPESGERYSYEFWESNNTPAKTDIEQDWRDYTGFENTQSFLGGHKYVVAPGTSYAIGVRSDELKVKWTQVTKTIKDGTWNAIYAKNDGELNYLINDMIRKAKAYGYDDCVAWAQNEAAIRRALEVESMGQQP